MTRAARAGQALHTAGAAPDRQFNAYFGFVSELLVLVSERSLQFTLELLPVQGFFSDCCSFAPLEVSLREPLAVLEREELVSLLSLELLEVSLELLAEGELDELLEGEVV